MKAVICPTVTAATVTEFRHQLENIQNFAHRIHLDFMDGEFAPTKSIDIKDAFWQHGPAVDLHVMHKHPLKELENIVALQPHMVIIHAEAEGVEEFFKELSDLGIKKGLALLQPTSVESVKDLLPLIDHVLLFSGNLGHFGGTINLGLLDKAKQLVELKPSLEIGWDGGINDHNAHTLAAGGVDVLNVGGFIQKAENPEDAYDRLVAEITKG